MTSATFAETFEAALRALAAGPLTADQRRVVETLAAADPTSEDEADSTARICAAFLRALTLTYDKQVGRRVIPHWGQRGPVRPERGGVLPPWRSWVDHEYRLRRDGETTFVTEPYQLHSEDIGELHALSEAGWDVTVTAGGARHFPASTVVVHLRRRAETSAAPGPHGVGTLRHSDTATAPVLVLSGRDEMRARVSASTARPKKRAGFLAPEPTSGNPPPTFSPGPKVPTSEATSPPSSIPRPSARKAPDVTDSPSIPPNALDVAVGALVAEHLGDATADVLVGALARFREEVGLALTCALAGPEHLAGLIEVAEHLALEPDSPTVPAWRAFVDTVRYQVTALQVDEGLVVPEAEAFLDEKRA